MQDFIIGSTAILGGVLSGGVGFFVIALVLAILLIPYMLMSRRNGGQTGNGRGKGIDQADRDRADVRRGY